MRIPLEEAVPAEVVLKVLGGHAVEAAYPGFLAAVVVIDVLDVEDPFQYANALLHIDSTMGDPGLASKGFIDVGTIRTADGLRIDEWPKHGNDMRASSLSRQKSAVWPLRSRITRTATRSGQVPRIRPTPPRRRAGRGKWRCPLSDSRKKVSSASTMPFSCMARCGATCCRKR